MSATSTYYLIYVRFVKYVKINPAIPNADGSRQYKLRHGQLSQVKAVSQLSKAIEGRGSKTGNTLAKKTSDQSICPRRLD